MASDTEREKLQFLWEEYRYRHDLCWRTVTQLTLCSTFLVALPYISPDVATGLKYWVLPLPGLAVALVIYGWLTMRNELHALDRVKTVYRRLQSNYLSSKFDERRPCLDVSFNFLVLTFIGILAVLGIAAIAVTALVWIPHLT